MSIIEPSTRHDIVIKRNTNLMVKGKNIARSPINAKHRTSAEFKGDIFESRLYLNKLGRNEERPKSDLKIKDSKVLFGKISRSQRASKIAKVKNNVAESATKLNDFVMRYKQRMEQYNDWKRQIPRMAVRSPKRQFTFFSTPLTPKPETVLPCNSMKTDTKGKLRKTRSTEFSSKVISLQGLGLILRNYGNKRKAVKVQ